MCIFNIAKVLPAVKIFIKKTIFFSGSGFENIYFLDSFFENIIFFQVQF